MRVLIAGKAKGNDGDRSPARLKTEDYGVHSPSWTPCLLRVCQRARSHFSNTPRESFAMISTWIGSPFYSGNSPQQGLEEPPPNAAAGISRRRAAAESGRPRCSGRRGRRNRRESARSEQRAEITLDLLGLRSSRRRTVKAQVVNAAEGGLCIVLNRSLLISSVLRCRFAMPGSDHGIPTLMQVRWVKQMDNGLYRCGLMYLV
jgi:hypothetical protein